MQDPERRIPYNYTSADDRQIVRHLFGSSLIEQIDPPEVSSADPSSKDPLASLNKDGRFSRLLFRLMGDLFIIERNAFLFQELAENSHLMEQLAAAFNSDLSAVQHQSEISPETSQIAQACHQKLTNLLSQIKDSQTRCGKIIHALGPVLGKDNIYFDAFNLTAHITDATDWRRYKPVAVLRPEHETQVPEIIKKVRKLGYHLIPRGAGTGLTGGATPLRDTCIMLNTEKLNAISPIGFETRDDGEKIAFLDVGAGVITQAAMDAADAAGFVFATDPTSAWACTIGGNLSENAGGKKAVMYGTAIDNVLSYTIAMPDGLLYQVKRKNHPRRKIRPDDLVEFEIFHPDGQLPDDQLMETISLSADDIRKKGLGKDVTSKSLKGLLGLQKEGCDGIITSARFILHPKLKFSKTLCIEFFGNDMSQAGRVIQDITQAFSGQGASQGASLMALEHFDEEYIKAIHYKTKTNVASRLIAVLLIDLMSDDAGVLDNGIDQMEDLLADYDKTGLAIARDDAEAERFWQDRKRLGAIAAHTNAFKLNEDIVLPIDSLADFASWVDQCNIEEKKYNQGIIIQRIVEYLQTAVPDTDPELLQRRAGQAKDLAYNIRKKLDIASRDALEAYIHAKQFLRDVVDSLRGFPKIAAHINDIYGQTRARLIVIATHMHAGDGNVHVNIPVLSNDRDMMQRANMTADRVMEKAVELNGVVSGEHGIGITKIKHLDDQRRLELTDYRKKVDPHGIMNPDKLSDPDIIRKVFTPSFNLLELEARILKYGELSELALKVARCVRCGKCKVKCPVFFPAENMFYHPRNKNLAIGALIEAVLYVVQRTHESDFKILKNLNDIADHCTICHKCFTSCPVDIDSGILSIAERNTLQDKKLKHTALATQATLNFLSHRRSPWHNIHRAAFLSAGARVQRICSSLLAPVAGQSGFTKNRLTAMLKTPVTLPGKGTLSSFLSVSGDKKAILLAPESDSEMVSGSGSRATVFYFPGCGSERMFTKISLASLYLLLAHGVRVILPPPNLCCGYPFMVNAKAHAHDTIKLENAMRFSQIQNMFKDTAFDAVIVSCGTCMESLDHIGAASIFDAPLKDISEFVLERNESLMFDRDYLYHAPCHDSLKDKAMSLLRGRMGEHQQLRALPACCSEAGTLSLSRPDISNAMLTRKETLFQDAKKTGHVPVLTNCPSCVQGLGRLSREGARPVHLAVELARIVGGTDWEGRLTSMTRHPEMVTF